MTNFNLFLFALGLFWSGHNLEETNAVKLDCFPTSGATKEGCESRGCIWSPVDKNDSMIAPSYGESLPFNDVKSSDQIPTTVGEPWCYFPDDYVGYRITEKSGASSNRVKLMRSKPSGLPDDIQELVVEVSHYDNSLRVKIIDANTQRFEPELPVMDLNDSSNKGHDFEHEFNEIGHLIVRRKSTGAVVFDTDLRKLIYSDKFIQLNTRLSTPFVYGLGEHYDKFLKMANSFKAYSFWNTDRLPLPGGTRSYGGFPFYINFDSDMKRAHGLYLRSSNGMDIVLQSDQSVTLRPIGGILDIILFSGPTPNEVVVQYQQAVGLPQLPPRWALGFQLCRFCYNSLEKTKLVVQRTREAKIPFDVQWNDADSMDKRNDFTYDHEKFEGLPEFVKSLHKINMHYMLLFDPGISLEKNYYPYKLGRDMDIYIKNATNQTLIGKVWNLSGETVFPDFSNPKSIDYWTELFVRFQEELNFDGAWIDMNDISNFVDGSVDGCPSDNPLERPVYFPGGYGLSTKSLCLSAKLRAGNEYDLHNLYSFYEAIATSKALQAARPGKRPMIISRSSHPGQGVFSGHWNGDLQANWDYLKWSVISLIEHSMYGYSLMGSDICGFAGNTTPQLCARWSTVGAFYTFSRNHNDDVSIDQDPVALGPEVIDANRNALNKRYSLLPYLYSLMHRAHRVGEPVVQAVPFEFYETDPESLKVEYQFMWGKGLMISPVVDQDTYRKSTYLPRGRWYETDILPSTGNGSSLVGKVPKWIDSKGEWHETKDISLANIPLFYRGGHIVSVYSQPKQTIPETVDQPIGLEIALCPMNRAHGEVYLDDGDSIHDRYNHATMKLANNRLVIKLDQDDYDRQIAFGLVKVYGINAAINEIKANEKLVGEFELKDHVLAFDLNGSIVTKNQDLIVEWH